MGVTETEVVSVESLEEQVEVVRAFNEFYHRRINMLMALLDYGPHEFTSMRILHQIFSQPGQNATSIGKALIIDAGYLSRSLQELVLRGLVTREDCRTDRRSKLFNITPEGMRQLHRVFVLSRRQAKSSLMPLRPEQRGELVEAMTKILRLLDHEKA